VLAEDAIKAAISDYKKKQRTTWARESRPEATALPERA
jgi:hypothetical protein